MSPQDMMGENEERSKSSEVCRSMTVFAACGDQGESAEVIQMKEELTKAEHELEKLTASATQASRTSEEASRAEKLALKRESEASASADAARIIKKSLDETKLEVSRALQELEHQEEIKKARMLELTNASTDSGLSIVKRSKAAAELVRIPLSPPLISSSPDL